VCSCTLFTPQAGNSVLREAKEFRVLLLLLSSIWDDGLSPEMTYALAIHVCGDRNNSELAVLSPAPKMVNKFKRD
jgi:hypothetical protein